MNEDASCAHSFQCQSVHASAMMDIASGERPTGLRASRDKETQQLRAKAPLAAQFEDCAQAVRLLHTALNADSSIEEQTPLRILVDRCLGRLLAWGHDTGASSRVLDHSLRRASKPRDNVLTFLKELHELVVNGTHNTTLPCLFCVSAC